MATLAAVSLANAPHDVAHESSAATTLVVSVGDAATGAFIENAQVRLPSVGRVERTTWNGEAQFTDLPGGRYRVQVRMIGYAAGDIDIQLKGDTVGVFFQLERVSVALDTVRVTGTPAPTPAMAEFEVRRRMGIGRFLTDSALNRDRVQSLPLVLATHIPGIMVHGRGVATLEPSGLLGNLVCPTSIYLDGFKLADADLENIRPYDLAGVEVYSRASAPVQYRPQGNYCKVILLWSKW